MSNAFASPVIVKASSAVTATGTGAAVVLPRGSAAYAFTLDVSAAATDVGDTLDVKIQTYLEGYDWLDICTFTQVLGNGGVKRYISKCAPVLATAAFEVGTALTAGNIRNIVLDRVRAVWAVVDAGTANVSFTFSVSCWPMG